MKRVICLLLSVLGVVCALSACKEEYSPEDAVRGAYLDDYHTQEEYMGQTFGLIMKDFHEDSFIITSSGGEYLWDVNYTVNNDVTFLNSNKVDVEYDSKTEDVVCVTLSEHIDYESIDDTTYSYIFSVDKSTQKVTPLIYITTINGVLQEDRTINDPNLVIEVLYSCLKYWRSDIEYLKENVYNCYNDKEDFL